MKGMHAWMPCGVIQALIYGKASRRYSNNGIIISDGLFEFLGIQKKKILGKRGCSNNK